MPTAEKGPINYRKISLIKCTQSIDGMGKPGRITRFIIPQHLAECTTCRIKIMAGIIIFKTIFCTCTKSIDDMGAPA